MSHWHRPITSLVFAYTYCRISPYFTGKGGWQKRTLYRVVCNWKLNQHVVKVGPYRLPFPRHDGNLSEPFVNKSGSAPAPTELQSALQTGHVVQLLVILPFPPEDTLWQPGTDPDAVDSTRTSLAVGAGGRHVHPGRYRWRAFLTVVGNTGTRSVPAVRSQCLDTAHPLPEYDFVVVGAGSAGCAVAARLSENPAWRVLLLEAGGDPPPASDVPALTATLQRTEVDWSYLTEPDGRTCLSHVGGQCSWPCGKVLGSSSVINAMIYIRGSPQDYDSWAALGNNGWSYQDVLPFFRKLEDFDEEDLKRRPHTEVVHGRGGPIQAAKPAMLDPGHQVVEAAAKRLGYTIIEDFSAEPNLGFGQVHCTINNGSRWNAALGYLAPAKERNNIHVVKFGYVTKVLINTTTMTADGVQYLKNGKLMEIRATKEVILSAGTINTPYILMHSGIGPKEHLEDIGIMVVKDSKVGHNLQLHIPYTGLYYTRKPVQAKSTEEDVFEYLTNRTGPLSTTGMSSYLGFVQTDKMAHHIPGLPDILLYFLTAQKSLASVIANIFNYDREATEALKEMLDDEEALLVLPTLLAPRSRGRVRPMVPPAIEPGYFQDPRDLDNLLAGVEVAHQLGNTGPMHTAGYSVRDLPLGACAGQQPLTRDYWHCVAHHPLLTLHPVGTAKMGPASDSDTVVDSQLRVHGVRNLWVADASIMPLIVHSNTNVPSIMIGEKCAHMVTQHWRRQYNEAYV
ncbi:glucose dehydrogenase [FAD, quinone]-like [Schistocerca piceifrons]|uniref:glucose dehydrogenase [FAD, quinone]-like n=1 Tax=Schistocerca piceifrons TaxID=274613 RepID=UPI001F5FC500|nr:glucose dehydrogenase [FAD, quinone]-like [Schistocerca piceifrons]